MWKTYSIVVSVSLSVWASATLPAAEADLPPRVRKMIEWLPEDTETLLVVNKPFTFTGWDKQIGEDAPDRTAPENRITFLSEAMQRVAAGGLISLEIKELNDALQDLPVERAIAGSRRFRSANGLGAWPYEGCQIIECKETAQGAITSAFTICQNHATATTEIGGHAVAVFKRPSQRRFEQDDWTFYVCQPRPGLLLRATHQQYLQEVLARLDERGQTRAFPKELAQWKHVDVKSPLWALRHYRMDRAKKDPSIPLDSDPGAIGFTFWLEQGAKSPKARYLTKTERADRIISPHWNDPIYGLTSETKVVEPGVVEITAEFPTELAPGTYLLFLMNYLGHGVNL